jgi:site-specific DNA recombinase
VAELQGLLPRERAVAIGAIYARYSSRFQHSILDQVRSLLDKAIAEKIFVPREHICFDQGIRGTRERRPGLQQLQTLLATGTIQVLLVFTTNRLFRKTYRALQFVEEDLVERGIRCLFVKSGVDTADEKRWRMLLQVHSITDEAGAGMYADNIRAAHEGLFRKQQVCGTVTFGYRQKPVDGPGTRRKLPRSEYEIDPEQAHWVRLVFRWYVEEGLSLATIIRKLNEDPSIPLGPKSVSGRWTRLGVLGLLRNARYRGLWSYGKTKNIWLSSKDYGRQVPREQPLQEEQFEELRIVSDEIWFLAQKRLAEERETGGRKPKDGQRRTRPRLLNGFFFCPTHDHCLYVGGPHGQMMVCPVCQGLPVEQRSLYSMLNRRLALRLTCQKLADLIRADDALLKQALVVCQHEAAHQQQPDSHRQAELKARLDKLNRQIQFILNNPGETDTDRQEAEVTLRQLRRERAQTQADLAQLSNRQRPIEVPSEGDLKALLEQLSALLVHAAESEDQQEQDEARHLIQLLTGGRIELFQMGERKAQQGWLQGRFRVRVLSVLVAQATGLQVVESAEGPEVVLDYREPTESEQWADKVKEFYDEGLLIKDIASRLGINRNLASLALACWFKQRGLEVPDGRSRRATLRQKHLQAPPYIAEQVKELYDQGLLLQEIASRLQYDPNTITSAVAYWFGSRGLAVPDGRSRRKTLDKKTASPPSEEGQETDGEAQRQE